MRENMTMDRLANSRNVFVADWLAFANPLGVVDFAPECVEKRLKTERFPSVSRLFRNKIQLTQNG